MSRMNKNHRVFFKYSLFLWLGLIWFLSTLPSESLPKIDSFNLDKAAHVVVYFIFSVLIFFNYRMDLFSNLSRQEILFIAVILSSFDEAHQIFVPNRMVSLFDLMANLAGLFLGYFIISKKKITYD